VTGTDPTAASPGRIPGKKWDSLNFGQPSIRNVVCVTFQVRGCNILAIARRLWLSSFIHRMVN
jgi:hypothetical protein